MLRSLLEIAAVVLFRFPPAIRAWPLLVAAVNAASLFFLGTLEGRVVLIALLAALAIMAPVYMNRGFVRLLGLGHVTWIAMLPWLCVRLPHLQSSPLLYRWLVLLIVINTICLVVDALDVGRYLAGDREPHYRLQVDPAKDDRDEVTD